MLDVTGTNLFPSHSLRAFMKGPDPQEPHPMVGFPQVCFIKNRVSNPNIDIGDYTYYDDPDGPENFERNVSTISISSVIA